MCVYFRVVHTCGHRLWKKACYQDWGNCECRLTHPRHYADHVCDRCEAEGKVGPSLTPNLETRMQPEQRLQKCAAWLISLSDHNTVTATTAEYQRPSDGRSIGRSAHSSRRDSSFLLTVCPLRCSTDEIYMETLRTTRQTARQNGELADDTDDDTEWSWYTSHTLSDAGINGDSDLDADSDDTRSTLGRSEDGENEDSQTGTTEDEDM